MDVFNQLISVENIVLCFAIVALVWFQRKLVELSFPAVLKEGTKLRKWWKSFFIPLGPIGSGGLLTLIPQIPVPEMFADGSVSRIVFGVFLGLISGLVFRLVKKNFINQIGAKKKEDETEYL